MASLGSSQSADDRLPGDDALPRRDERTLGLPGAEPAVTLIVTAGGAEPGAE